MDLHRHIDVESKAGCLRMGTALHTANGETIAGSSNGQFIRGAVGLTSNAGIPQGSEFSRTSMHLSRAAAL
jgi:hypothetical protein